MDGFELQFLLGDAEAGIVAPLRAFFESFYYSNGLG